MEQIKVLNIITGGLKSDGITSSWIELCRELKNQGMQDKVLIDFLMIKDKSVDAVKNEFENLGYNIIEIETRLSNPFQYLSKLIKIIKKHQYDIVHVNGSSSTMALDLLAAYLADVKIRIAHSRNTTSDHKRIHKLLYPAFKKLTTNRLACGKNAGEWLFKNEDFTVFHNGKDFSMFSFSPNERNLARTYLKVENKTVLGHVGKFNDQKNHVFLVEVFCEYLKTSPNSILLLLGDGYLMPKIQKLVKEKGIASKVIFAGAVKNVSFFLQAADIMIFPSIFEGLPNVVLEWQAMGLPVIMSDRITTECICSPLVKTLSLDASSREWAIRIQESLKLPNDRDLNSQLGIQNLTQERFDIKDSAYDLVNYYINAINERDNKK